MRKNIRVFQGKTGVDKNITLRELIEGFNLVDGSNESFK